MNLLENMTFPVALFDGGVWDIISHSTWFGILIMVALLAFSLLSWAIIVAKSRVFRAEEADSEGLLERFRRTPRLADTVNLSKQYHSSVLSALLSACIEELVEIREKREKTSGEGVAEITPNELETIQMTLERASSERIHDLELGVTFLATTANSAPFLGLLGTVVGIMVSFWEIGQTGSASLAIVAPGIAEALLATIFGLAAAIPAVIAYNWANRRLRTISERTGNFSLELFTRIRKEFMS